MYAYYNKKKRNSSSEILISNILKIGHLEKKSLLKIYVDLALGKQILSHYFQRNNIIFNEPQSVLKRKLKFVNLLLLIYYQINATIISDVYGRGPLF